jgi:hypothetical protein
MIFTSTWLWHRRGWWQHLLMHQKSSALFQIMPINMMDLAPLLYIYRVVERSSLLLLCRFLNGDLLNCFKIGDLVVEGIDDLNVLDVQDSIFGIATTFHIVLETFIMLLLDGLQSFYCGRLLVRTLEVLDEHGT